MKNIEGLDIVRKIAACGSIGVTVVSEQGADKEDFDLGIRRRITLPGNAQDFVEKLLRQSKEGSVCFFTDYFETEYCVLPRCAAQGGGVVVLGPYRETDSTEYQLLSLINEKEIPSSYHQELSEYYRCIPTVPMVGKWRRVCVVLAGFLQDTEAPVEMVYSREESLKGGFLQPGDEPLLSFDLIEKRYAMEGEIMRAITRGDTDAALAALQKLGAFRLASRYQDPLRDVRNGLITSNSLWRKAAEYGGVHPAHIDELSSRMARQIETIRSAQQGWQFMGSMLRKYCLLVQNRSLRGHSPVIQKVVNHINLNLASDLSLSGLAKSYSVNTSYLSSLFKKEMGVTITDYISRQRIQYAIKLLNATSMTISDVASECGIYDVNYFRRLFKKIIGKTPTAYARDVGRQGVENEEMELL